MLDKELTLTRLVPRLFTCLHRRVQWMIKTLAAAAREVENKVFTRMGDARKSPHLVSIRPHGRRLHYPRRPSMAAIKMCTLEGTRLNPK